MKNEAPLYLNCIFDGLRSVNNNGSCWNNGCVFCLVAPLPPHGICHPPLSVVTSGWSAGPRAQARGSVGLSVLTLYIITGYSHNQPQLAFLSLSQHFVLLHRIKTCYANTVIIDLIINPISCATISAGVTPT